MSVELLSPDLASVESDRKPKDRVCTVRTPQSVRRFRFGWVCRRVGMKER